MKYKVLRQQTDHRQGNYRHRNATYITESMKRTLKTAGSQVL